MQDSFDTRGLKPNEATNAKLKGKFNVEVEQGTTVQPGLIELLSGWVN